MKFAIIKALDEAHIYSVFANELRQNLHFLGHSADIIRVEPDTTHYDIFERIHGKSLDCVISFSSLLGALEVEPNKSMYDAAGVRFVGWQFDHPLYALHNLSPRIEGRLSIYPNKNHLVAAEMLGITGQNAVMLAGGSPMLEPVREFDHRDIPLLVPATWNGEPEKKWSGIPDEALRDFLDCILETAREDAEVSIMDAFKHACVVFGYGIKIDKGVVEILSSIFTYIRHLDRLNGVKLLVDAGFPVVIIGSGWKRFFGNAKSIRYLDTVSFIDLHHVYNRAKIVVNFNSGNGGCERSIYAMLAGAAVVSDFSSSYESHGIKSDCIQFFKRATSDDIAKVVGDLLDGDGGARFAENGYNCAMTSQLWRHRAQSLIDALK